MQNLEDGSEFWDSFSEFTERDANLGHLLQLVIRDDYTLIILHRGPASYSLDSHANLMEKRLKVCPQGRFEGAMEAQSVLSRTVIQHPPCWPCYQLCSM